MPRRIHLTVQGDGISLNAYQSVKLFLFQFYEMH